jgi:hydrogenase maturation protease
MRVLIIGYGNPLRGDDAFGFTAAERLKELLDDPEVEVLPAHQLTPELMDPLARAERVIFIDAAAPDPAVSSGRSAFTHHITPANLVAGARALYGCAAEPTVLTTPGENFDFGAPLSASVSSALEKTIDQVLSIVRRSSTS